MEIFPELRLVWLNGFLYIVPLMLVRYGVPPLIRRRAREKLFFVPPVHGRAERSALGIYFPAILFLLFTPLLFPLRFASPLFEGATLLYLVGLFFQLCSVVNFSAREGFTYRGIYRISRNPMYLGYGLSFIGIALAIGSGIHLVVVAVYQIAVHFIVLSEERWCRRTFGRPYLEYCRRVPRYLLRGGRGLQ
jgi:protein-S-isoprenylcysteine O-methyltransferase Ste14